jgi:hypothetical protein
MATDELVFIDRLGDAVAYKAADDDVVFLWSGTAIAIIDEESVLAFNGRRLGWFVDGWIRDHKGACVYFTDGAMGGMARPARKARAARGARRARPARGARRARPARAANRQAWSTLADGRAFFDS